MKNNIQNYKLLFKYYLYLLFITFIMYNTKFVCTYNTPDVFFETDDITDTQRDFIREVIYRQELLNILGIEEFNEEEIHKELGEVYEKIKDYPKLKECMNKLAENFMSTDAAMGFLVLFVYDYMYVTHVCISEFLDTGEISDTNVEKLKAIIFA